MTIKEKFVEGWRSRLRNSNRHPKLELYKELKSDFHFEPYLDLVREFKYRNALTKIRSSSHLLQIEHGRHTKPKIPRNNRLCLNCKTIEDERYFVMECPLYREERCVLLSKVSNNNPTFSILSTQEKFVYLLSCKDAQILTWLGKSDFQKKRHTSSVREERCFFKLYLNMMCFIVYVVSIYWCCMYVCMYVCVWYICIMHTY